MTTVALAALALLTWTAGDLHAQEDPRASIQGHVTSEDGKPLAAEVVVTGTALVEMRRVHAGEDGRFRVTGLPPGDYRLRVAAYGYREQLERVEGIGAGEARSVEVVLTPAPFSVGELEVVTATRSLQSAREVPAAVSVIDREQVEQQTAVSTDIGEILGQAVPGLSPTTESATNFGQTLRGRDLTVLIDGVPMNTPLRNGQRSLRTIDPAAVERVEVVRGATAVYGFGGTGGIINIITRTPDTDEVRARTTVRGDGSTNQLDGSLSGRISQSVSGGAGPVRFTAGGAYESRGKHYDARGDLIPVNPQGQGGLANAEGLNLFGNAAVELTDDQEVQVTGLYYELLQEDPGFVTVPGVPGEEKATAEAGDPGSEDVGNENAVVQARYRHGDLLGSVLETRAYYQDNVSRFSFSPFFNAQSRITSEKQGLRLDVQTPLRFLTEGARVRWGADFQRDETAQPLGDGRFFVPPMDQLSLGPFAQLTVPVVGRLTAHGGVRREQIWLDVDDFTTIQEVGGNFVEGGDLQYDATVFNAGLTYGWTEWLESFASFSQGFSVAEVGRELRTTSAASVEALDPAPKEVDSWELGVRGQWDRARFALSGYLSESDLGSTFGPDLRIQRAPEEIRGLEADVEATPVDRWTFGGTLTLVEGERDADDDGEVDDPLNSIRIPPTKVTGHVENATLPGWRNRLQLIHSGSRNEFPGSEAFGEGAVESYTVVDFTSALDLWQGTVTLSVENLFDEFYFPVASQATNLGFAFSAGQGRRLSLEYRVDW